MIFHPDVFFHFFHAADIFKIDIGFLHVEHESIWFVVFDQRFDFAVGRYLVRRAPRFGKFISQSKPFLQAGVF